jgi:hypothetical protein
MAMTEGPDRKVISLLGFNHGSSRLLGVLFILAAPAVFAAGRLGWIPEQSDDIVMLVIVSAGLLIAGLLLLFVRYEVVLDRCRRTATKQWCLGGRPLKSESRSLDDFNSVRLAKPLIRQAPHRKVLVWLCGRGDPFMVGGGRLRAPTRALAQEIAHYLDLPCHLSEDV